jgi:predicted MPP superfamily phosphohydrolase
MKLQATGRGRGYSRWRGFLESALEVLYPGDWPARLWALLPTSHNLSVKRHSLELPEGAGPRCRVAFASDLHVGPTTPYSLLERAFEAIRTEQPDVLLLGGDYVFLEATPARLRALRTLVESVPCSVKLAVLGNHDLWTCDRAIAEALSLAGVRVLVNEAATLPKPWNDVAIIGLDDPWTGHRNPAPATAKAEDAPFRIVLCHSPDGLGLIPDLRFDLFLAGHTHGGQVATPWGPIVLPHGRLCREYPAGFGHFGSGAVYVSRGVGGVELPVRTFATPDVAIVDLIRKTGAAAAGLTTGVTRPADRAP